MKMKRPLLFSALAGLAPFAWAGFLTHSINLRVLTFDGQITLLDRDQGTVVVDGNVEYPELQGEQGSVSAVPVSVDIDDSTISLDFSRLGFGSFLTAEFNGYVLTDVNDELPAFTGVNVVSLQTTLPITDDEVTFNEDEIRINVSGLEYNASSFLQIAVDFPWWKTASVIQPDGWYYFDWFKGFKPEGENWIYHGRHGWLYVLVEDTSRMFLWDGALGRWLFTNATVYPWMYAYGPDGGWVFFFEGGRPGSRYFKRQGSGEVVSEVQLRSNP